MLSYFSEIAFLKVVLSFAQVHQVFLQIFPSNTLAKVFPNFIISCFVNRARDLPAKE